MAGRLNGDGRPAVGSRRLRVLFAAGAAPTGLADGATGRHPGGGRPSSDAARDSDPATDRVVELDAAGEVTIGGVHWAGVLEALAPPRARLVLNGAAAAPDEHQVLISRLPEHGGAATGVRRLEIVVDGWRFELDVDSEARARLRERATSVRGDAARGGPAELRAIIPGRVVSVDVAEGDAVDRGGRLLVLEAMKMQNELRAPRAGTVARVAVAPGQTVELGDLLVVLE